MVETRRRTKVHQLTIQLLPLQLSSRHLPCILTLQGPRGDGENSFSLHIYTGCVRVIWQNIHVLGGER